MNEIRRTNQGGSIVTFIIVGVILAFALVGSVYYLRQHGEQVRKDQAIAAADKQIGQKAQITLVKVALITIQQQMNHQVIQHKTYQ